MQVEANGPVTSQLYLKSIQILYRTTLVLMVWIYTKLLLQVAWPKWHLYSSKFEGSSWPPFFHSIQPYGHTWAACFAMSACFKALQTLWNYNPIPFLVENIVAPKEAHVPITSGPSVLSLLSHLCISLTSYLVSNHIFIGTTTPHHSWNVVTLFASRKQCDMSVWWQGDYLDYRVRKGMSLSWSLEEGKGSGIINDLWTYTKWWGGNH